MNKLIHPSAPYENTIREICNPLFKNTRIKYFAHCTLNEKNELAGLSTHEKITELYLNNKHYNYDIISQDLKSQKYIIWDLLNFSNQQILKNHHIFNLGHSFTIIKEEENIKECFHFCGDLNDDSINGYYLQYVDILETFIAYFKDKVNTNKNLRRIYDTRYSVTYNSDSSLERFVSEEPTNTFETKKYIINASASLSKCEIMCLYWLSKGKTMDETAILLQITHRTVRAHIENSKKKLNCFTLFQLGQAFQYHSLERYIEIPNL